MVVVVVVVVVVSNPKVWRGITRPSGPHLHSLLHKSPPPQLDTCAATARSVAVAAKLLPRLRMAGTSFDIVVLSSSPPAHDLYAPSSPLNGSPRPSPRRVAMPASALLTLSPPASPQKKTSGASGPSSRKASIPPDAIRGFATVGSLVRSEHFAPQVDDESTTKQSAPRRRGSLENGTEDTASKKKPRKRAAAASTVDGDAKPKPKPKSRKPKAANQEATTIATHDPELRLPAPKISPFFPTEGSEISIESPTKPADPEPKLTKSGKPRKPRAKKEKAEGEDILPKPRKPRVTKPRANAKVVEDVQQEGACVESAHFRKDDVLATSGPTTEQLTNVESAPLEDLSIWEVPQSPQPKKKRAPKQRPPAPVIESLDLDEAVSRRRDWTPPRDTARASPFTDSIGKENKQVDADAENGGFNHMISNFAYAQSLPAQITATTTSTMGAKAVTKRRRVEVSWEYDNGRFSRANVVSQLIDLPANQATSRNSSPEKGKAPKKKPRTITDIATEQYQTRTAELDPSDVSSELLQPRTTVTKVPLDDGAGADDEGLTKKPPRKRSTSKQDSGKATSRAKSKKTSTKSTAKSKAAAEKLLSPGTALMRMNKQDILFGTSSQLALEESPTMVRQLQYALRESEVEADRSLHHLLPPPPRWPKLVKAIGKRGLWEASSRDVEGGLLEQMEDVYIPDFDRAQEFPLLMDGTNDDPPAGPDSFVDIDNVGPRTTVIISSDAPTSPHMTAEASLKVPATNFDTADHVTMDSVFVDIDDFHSQPPPSNQNAEPQDSFVDIDDLLPILTHLDTAPPPKPRLTASIAATGSPEKRRGRPTKSQSAMPATKDEQVSATKRNNGKAESSKNAASPPATPCKGSDRFVDIDEILDSEDEVMLAFSPTPPRTHDFSTSQPLPLVSTSPTRAKGKKAKSVVDLDVVSVHSIPTGHLEWAGIKSSVFSSITAHIRSLLPSTDPKKPTWHEKILMYTPIVLEDFTPYLIANTDVRTWKRATKVQIKAWNKYLKANGEDEVFVFEGGDDVLATKKELELWQVQAWCESMSVCCIHAPEARGRGSARKGLY
jgi:hypothetical protein